MSKGIIFFVLLCAAIVDANNTGADQNISIEPVEITECEITKELEYQPISNGTGKQILTSKKIYKSCKRTVTKRGDCKKWESEITDFTIPKVHGVEVIKYESLSDLGDVLATIEAINRSNVIFSGVKGRCEQGWTEDTSWLEDPLFIAGIVMQAIAAAGEDPDASSAEGKVNETTSTEAANNQRLTVAEDQLKVDTESMNLAEGQATDARLNYKSKQATYEATGNPDDFQSMNIAKSNYDAATTNYDSSVAQFEISQSSHDVAYQQWDASVDAKLDASDNLRNTYDNQTGAQKFSRISSTGYSGCAVQAVVQALGAGYNYANEEEKECDPIDEFCKGDGDESTGAPDPSQIFTVTQEDFDLMNQTDPDYANAFEVIKVEDGFVTIGIKQSSELVNLDGLEDEEAIKKAYEEAKILKLKMDAAMIAIQTTACMGTQLSSDMFGTPKATASTGSAGDFAAGLATSAITGLLPFPYNTMASFAQKLMTTWEKVDTCNNEDDATARGGRHEAAYKGLRFNTCHQIKPETCVEEWAVTHDCMRDLKEYCCYESPISKILMVQIKAEVGKGWTHCTDVSMNELAHISWRNCSQEDKDPSKNGGFEDGATFMGIEGTDYDMKESFQFQRRCLDLDELRAYIELQTGIEYSNANLEDFLNDFKQGDN